MNISFCLKLLLHDVDPKAITIFRNSTLSYTSTKTRPLRPLALCFSHLSNPDVGSRRIVNVQSMKRRTVLLLNPADGVLIRVYPRESAAYFSIVYHSSAACFISRRHLQLSS